MIAATTAATGDRTVVRTAATGATTVGTIAAITAAGKDSGRR
jgi:hypothetical protein